MEIKEKARASGVPASTIERDYAQNWFLKAISSEDFPGILKGGTGIRKVYVPEYRFSEDLDFTLLEDISKKILRRILENAVMIVKRDSGLDFNEEIRIKENINGFEGIVYFRLLRSSGYPLRIKLDFTRPGMERIILEPELRKIIHSFTDDFSSNVMTYQLEEIIAEKLRALFQRTRPRDLYDIWFMRDNLESETILKVFSEKCEDKDIIPDLKQLMIRRLNFAHSWENSLKHLIKPLPDFNNTFEEVMEIIEKSVLSTVKDTDARD